MKVFIPKPVSEKPDKPGQYFVITKNGKQAIFHYTGSDISFINMGEYYSHYLVESESPVEVEVAAKEYAGSNYTKNHMPGAWQNRYDGFIAGANFQANHLGEDREGQDEWKQRFVNWFFAHKTYFPTPDKCADWFEKNVSVKDFVGDQDKLWRAVLDKVISDQILEHEEVPTDTINYLSNRYHLIKKQP